MKYKCIIPARGGSKRIPKKNLAVIGGIPLVSWAIRTAKEVFLPENIYVSSDHPKILNIAVTENVVPVQRPEFESSDTATDADVIRHIMTGVGSNGSAIAYLRPTTPFRSINVLKEAMQIFETENISRLICVEEMTESAYKSYMLAPNRKLYPLYEAIHNAPNQTCPKTYRNNGYLDLYRWPDGLEVLPFGFVVPRTIEIDIMEDLENARFCHERRKHD